MIQYVHAAMPYGAIQTGTQKSLTFSMSHESDSVYPIKTRDFPSRHWCGVRTINPSRSIKPYVHVQSTFQIIKPNPSQNTSAHSIPYLHTPVGNA